MLPTDMKILYHYKYYITEVHMWNIILLPTIIAIVLLNSNNSYLICALSVLAQRLIYMRLQWN